MLQRKLNIGGTLNHKENQEQEALVRLEWGLMTWTIETQWIYVHFVVVLATLWQTVMIFQIL